MGGGGEGMYCAPHPWAKRQRGLLIVLSYRGSVLCVMGLSGEGGGTIKDNFGPVKPELGNGMGGYEGHPNCGYLQRCMWGPPRRL